MNSDDVLRPQPIGIPVPHPSRWSRPYWDACRRAELTFLRCDECGIIPMKPVPACPECHGRSLAWHRSSGRGTIFSWTVVWRPQTPAFQVPYAPAVIEMEEGWWLLSSVVGCEPGSLTPGMPVQVEFHPASDDIWLPYVRPTGV